MVYRRKRYYGRSGRYGSRFGARGARSWRSGRRWRTRRSRFQFGSDSRSAQGGHEFAVVVPSVSPNFNPPGWPRVTKKMFTYNTTYATSTTITPGSVAGFEWRMNGPQDPDATSGGDNSYGWDQFMGTLYDRCYCYMAEITATFAPITSSSTTANPVIGGIHFRNNLTSAVTSSLADMLNQPHSPWRVVTATGQPVTIKRKCHIKQWLPMNNLSDMTCGPNNNPAAEVFALVWTANADQGNLTATNISITLRIRFHCWLGQTDILPAST